MYEKDIEGNIIGIYDMDSEGRVAKYEYDAWGRSKVCNADGSENTSETFIGNINAFRYKSYYYDSETKLYYLISRYYDPETGRFISPDHMGYALMSATEINGVNLYAYCLNNPIMYSDPEGTFIWFVFVAAIVIGAVAGGVSAGIESADNGAGIGETIGSVVLGVISGALIGAAIGSGLGAGIGGSIIGGGAAGAVISGNVFAGAAVASVGLSVVAGSSIIAGYGVAQLGNYLFSRPSRLSRKERSTDKPSWVNKGMIDKSLSAQQNATNILNNKYGVGNWKTGPSSEFSKIIKWIIRSLLS